MSAVLSTEFHVSTTRHVYAMDIIDYDILIYTL